MLEVMPKDWGTFMRYHYFQFDFTQIEKPGMYLVKYGEYKTSPFQIGDQIFKRNVGAHVRIRRFTGILCISKRRTKT